MLKDDIEYAKKLQDVLNNYSKSMKRKERKNNGQATD